MKSNNKSFISIFVNCPDCYSSNYLDCDEQSVGNRECDDCGFEIIKDISICLSKKECCVCGCQNFYVPFTWNPFRTSRNSECYFCETTYYETQKENLDNSFNQNTLDEVLQSPIAVDIKGGHLKVRIKEDY